MAATKRYMNWTGVAFTPTGSTATTITGVTSVLIDPGSHLLKFAGDGDRYSTTIVNDYNDPTVTVHAADLSAIQANPSGTTGTFTATHNDARNGTGTGAITYTLANAVISTHMVQGAHRHFGQGTFMVSAYSSDGTTNPLLLSIAP
jgi:hypothetical protein